IVRIARVKVGNRQAPYPAKTPPPIWRGLLLWARASLLNHASINPPGSPKTSGIRHDSFQQSPHLSQFLKCAMSV
ncbi:hypothetical protein, partial [Paraburkholderia kururiensis]|uniref:hypothetical protein n=1 Tax=Paraburkholderia kururiensis TaxID=984307 RepID=UPI001ABB90E1